MIIKRASLVSLFFTAATVFLSNVATAANNGSSHYQRHCAQCHGSDGQNRLPQAANFKRREGLRQSDKKLFQRIRNGKNGCPSYAGILKDQEILDLIVYLRKFGR